jgi:hypothetical protein
MARQWCGKAGVALALFAVLAVAACGPGQRTKWSKEGLTQDELRRDQKECVAEANGYGFLNSNPNSAGGSATNTMQQADLYRACMIQKGYSMGPGGTMQSKPGQSQQPKP